MYEVMLRNNKTQEEFTKVFWNKKEMTNFVRKVNKGKSLTLLMITDNSYMYD